MNTTENNKLIAEFMGRSISPITLAEFRKLKPRDKHLVSGAFVEDLQYHSDWNWLMEVVEKIENYNDSATLFIIEDERCHVNTQNGFEIDSVGHTKIEAVYNACLGFVKHYNEKK